METYMDPRTEAAMGERLVRVETKLEHLSTDVVELRRERKKDAEDNAEQHRQNQNVMTAGFEMLHGRINRQFRGALIWVLGLAGVLILMLLSGLIWVLTHPLPWQH